MAYIDKKYLVTQFNNFAEKATSVFAKKNELENYVENTLTIADIDLNDDITAEELKKALNVPTSENFVETEDIEKDDIDFSTFFNEE